MIEQWKDIDGFKNKYRISDSGRVEIKNYKNKGFSSFASILPGRDGYCRVYLNNGKSQAFLVHRLVAIYFLDKPDIEDRKQVNHIDGDKSNNNSKNLEWVNGYENVAHAKRIGLLTNVSELHYSAKLTNEEVKIVRKMLKTGKITQKKISDIFGVTPMAISNMVNGKTWREV